MVVVSFGVRVFFWEVKERYELVCCLFNRLRYCKDLDKIVSLKKLGKK